MKVVVIGAGASGVVAALRLASKNDVILVDGNDKTLKKLLLTGSGRANFWNKEIKLDNYETDNYDNLDKILKYQDDTYNYLLRLGIVPKVKDGYFYPNSNQASSLKKIFDNNLKNANIDIKYNFKVQDIKKVNKGFIVISDKEEITCEKIIIATGGITYPNTGSDGSIFKILSNLGLLITNLDLGLVPLIKKHDKSLSGVRQDAKVSLYIDDNFIKSDVGEVQFNDDTISGICTLNISRYIKDNHNVYVSLNFLSNIINENLDDWFKNRDNTYSVSHLLESILNYKLIIDILKRAQIKEDKLYQDLTNKEKETLFSLLTDYKIDILDKETSNKAQITVGGVSLNTINPDTMEVKDIPGLYVIGEALNVDGECGGFNLAFAFMTGFIVGEEDD